ncbi:unnamed protein product [Rhizoctonia solani]|uniref:Uncharacterized protein n=1 Tax=Rhizoctonia solani TaxID=456999 RepID=A0A8H3E9E1_9AGAM|nr:unnamed protein product [Rhizoctonia solani]
MLRDLLPPVLANNQGGANANVPHIADPRMELVRNEMQQLRQDSQRQLAEANQAIAELRSRMEYDAAFSQARAQNASARGDLYRLAPLPLPNGAAPAPGVFPRTLGDFRIFSGPRLSDLVQSYGLPPYNLADERRRALAGYFCIQF